MSAKKRAALGRKGGLKGKGHKFTTKTAVEAGRKGGLQKGRQDHGSDSEAV